MAKKLDQMSLEEIKEYAQRLREGKEVDFGGNTLRYVEDKIAQLEASGSAAAASKEAKEMAVMSSRRRQVAEFLTMQGFRGLSPIMSRQVSQGAASPGKNRVGMSATAKTPLKDTRPEFRGVKIGGLGQANPQGGPSGSASAPKNWLGAASMLLRGKK